MISPDAGRYGPFKVIVTGTGRDVTFACLPDATAYASKLLNVHNICTATYDAHGQLVGCTETLLDTGPYTDDAA